MAQWQNIDEVTADETTYIQRGAGAGTYDSHTYPSAGAPTGAIVEEVRMRFRMKAVNPPDPGIVHISLRQGGANYGHKQYVLDDANWHDEDLVLRYNPATGQAWTVADVNGGLEFVFQAPFSALAVRVTQAYVEVKYRTPESHTDYVGGLYEEQSDGTVTKYYAAGGVKAMRVETPAGSVPETGADCANTADDDSDTIVNDGCPTYLLADHLGGTTHVLDSSAAVLTEQKYWPYGGLRDGGITQPDKLYTGQQQEPGDSALGLYNYKARFYSTTLGRFVSADALTVDGWNRYAYVLNNPLLFADPSGLDALIVCGNGKECETGATGTEAWDWELHVAAYWFFTRRFTGDLHFIFQLMMGAMQSGWSRGQLFDVFDVGFMNTSPVPFGFVERDAGSTDEAFVNWADDLDAIIDSNSEIDFLIGYSLGAVTIMRWLSRAHQQDLYGVPELSRNEQIASVLLIQPASIACCDSANPVYAEGTISADQAPGILVVTSNHTGSPIRGEVEGGINLYTSSGCSASRAYHCNHSHTAARDVAVSCTLLPGRTCK